MWLLCCSSSLFVRCWFHMWRLFCHYLFLISPSFDASGGPFFLWLKHFLGIFTDTFFGAVNIMYQCCFFFLFVCLQWMDTLDRLSAILEKGDNFCDFLFAFLHSKTLPKRDGSTVTWKKLFLGRVLSSLLMADQFSERGKMNYERAASTSHWKCIRFLDMQTRNVSKGHGCPRLKNLNAKC